jgi:alkane 1-monooxygenase
MMRYLPYTLPVWLTLGFIAACYGGYFWVTIIILPAVSGLNPVFGQFSLQDLIKEYRFFHDSSGMEIFRGMSALFFIGFNAWVAYFLYANSLSIPHFLFFVYGVIVLNSNFAVSLAHDLMHSHHQFNRFLASSLLLINGFFYLETDHIRIHHKHVGTDKDPASALPDEPLYKYLLRSVSGRWKLIFIELKVYKRLNIERLCVCLFLLILSAFVSKYYFFCLLAQFIFVTLLYEVVTYIQHYGLRREGENVKIYHAWNCYYRLSSYLHYMMPIHAIHHLKEESDLDEIKDAGSSYPKSFSRMAILAFFPKLWIEIMKGPLNDVSEKYKSV